MDEQFDKNITNRVKEVFENYDDPFANEGWLKLREKFPEERRRRPVVWWWLGTAAAVLLVFFGIGLWMNDHQAPPKKIAYKNNKSTKPEPYHPAAEQEGKGSTGKLNKNNNVGTGELAAVYPRNKKSVRQGIENAFAFSGQNNYKRADVPKTPAPGNATGRNASVPQPDSGAQAVAKLKDEPAIMAQTKNKAAVDSVNSIAQRPAKSINSMFAGDKQLAKTRDEETQKKETKKIRFAVYAATYFNYAKGSDNQVNIGAGFSSEIPLNKNLSLVSGVSIGQNSLSYSGSASFAAVPASNSLIAGAASNFYASFASANGNGPNLNINTVKPTLKDYNASLVGLDIPVNLKYIFDAKKKDTYFIAGLSSGTFINETYTSQYNYPAQQTQDQTSRNSFNSFYFARTLNVALGTGFNMGKNRVIVEPFLKYPLDGLGSQQLRFGAGGINLKFNFQSPKK